MSVPDSVMLILLSDALDTSVSILLRKDIVEIKNSDLKITSEKLEIINLQLVRQKERKIQTEYSKVAEPSNPTK